MNYIETHLENRRLKDELQATRLQLGHATEELESTKRTLELYRDEVHQFRKPDGSFDVMGCWLRALDDRCHAKSHLIDGLAITTRLLRKSDDLKRRFADDRPLTRKMLEGYGFLPVASDISQNHAMHMEFESINLWLFNDTGEWHLNQYDHIFVKTVGELLMLAAVMRVKLP